MAGGACIGGGIVALAVGIALTIVGSFFLSSELTKLQTKVIKENIIVDSTSAKAYGDWSGGFDEKTNYQMVFYFFNLTNMEAVRKGVKPVYHEVGPYIYRRHRRSINVTFDDGGKLLRYSNLKDYTYERNMSVGDDSDVFVNINPVYLGALGQAQNELGMLTAMAPAYILEALNFLTGPFIPLFSIYKSPSYLSAKLNATLEALSEDAAYNNTQVAYEFFLDSWANAKTPPATNSSANWTGMLISQPSDVSSDIPLDSAAALWNSSNQYSLLSTDAEDAWVWANALKNPTPLLQAFNLTLTQLATVVSWRTDVFAPTYIFPDVMAQHQLVTISDLGWVQWFDGSPLDGQSVNDVWAELTNPVGVDYEFFAAGGTTFTSWQFSKQVLNSETGLTNIYIFQEWLAAQGAGATDFSHWNLTVDQSGDLFTYSFGMGNGFGAPALMELYGESGGLFRAKSVLEWVFNCEDYILSILQPDAPPCGLLVNDTYFARTTIRTGKDDINKINTYVEWRGMSNVTGLWAGPLKVEGHTALGQFQPGLKGTPNETLTVFDSNLVRSVDLVFNNTVTVKGLKANRYLVNWKKLFATSDFFYNHVFGFANMTAFQNAPIFLSAWDMANVENRTLWVDGLNTTSTELDWNTVLDVEPNTGSTVQAYQKLQANLYLPPQAKTYFQFSPFQNSPPVGIAYPIAKAGERVVLSDELAKETRDKLKVIPGLKKGGFWVCVTVGPALLLGGIALIVIGHRKRTKGNYQLIN